MDTEGGINICRNHGAALALDCLACVHLKVAVESLALASYLRPRSNTEPNTK
jgi:hypothetical protein